MGQPAARLGDPTVHGGSIVVGCPTVLIGGMPSARVGDMHVCPMVTGLVPHVGGPVVLGAFTVLAGGAPQARASDMAVCVGPPDTVAMGAPTVMVGEGGGGGGGAAAAVAGAVASGAHDVLGSTPMAEMLPDGTWETRAAPGVRVQGPPEFQAAVLRDMAAMRLTRSGRALLHALATHGGEVTLQPSVGAGNPLVPAHGGTPDDVVLYGRLAAGLYGGGAAPSVEAYQTERGPGAGRPTPGGRP